MAWHFTKRKNAFILLHKHNGWTFLRKHITDIAPACSTYVWHICNKTMIQSTLHVLLRILLEKNGDRISYYHNLKNHVIVTQLLFTVVCILYSSQKKRLYHMISF